MSRNRHIPAWDFDCEECAEGAPAEGASAEECRPAEASRPTRQKIHRRRTVGDAGEECQDVVSCPNRKAPTLDECIECPHFKGYSLDPSGRDSYVTCAFTPPLPAWPMPQNPTDRSRALRTRTGEVMSDALCVREDLPIRRLAALLVDNGIGGAPVVDGDGRLVGVVSKTDIVKASTREATVGEIMSRKVHSVPESASLTEATALMSFKKVHRIPVVGEEGRVVGILTSHDIARWLCSAEGTSSPAWRAVL